MKKRLTYLTSLVLFILLISCSTTQTRVLPSSVTPSGPRTIILDGEMISEVDVIQFTSWYCKDYIDGEQTVVEVGFYDDIIFNKLGFILYDGGYSGEKTYYNRTGLEHRWDWGPNKTNYSFVIKTDGTGVYYDFSTVPDGESTKGKSVYKCYKR